jgi:mannosyl-oligosaccharide alpha-1,2-mannosidase
MRSAAKQDATKERAGDRYWVETDDYMWIDALDKWKQSGSRGDVPGSKEKSPIIYTERQRLSGKAMARDYVVRRTGYLLRPEVGWVLECDR